MSQRIKAKRQLPSPEVLKNAKASCISFFSGLYHSVFFGINRWTSPFENGMLIMSIDVDVGSRQLGIINEGKNDRNVSSHMSEYEIGKIEEATIPGFIQLLDKYRMPATFAIRGQLTEVPDSALELLLKSPTPHDIGAHGYYHRKFRDLLHDEAETEIKMISKGMQRFGLNPKSFVFPRNSVAYLELLEKYGYECFRDYSNFLRDSMCISKHGKLWEVHASLFIDKHLKFAFLKMTLNVAMKRRLPMHLWFHMRDFGNGCAEIQRNMERVLVPLFDYADRKREEGVLTFETMLSAARKARAMAMCLSNSERTIR